ncbi:ankyrin [Zopfia rhizophila CBS 207.26]|uniref:Ankyrin n=1 Tax=Zopfia rhizophila CBS 207.26 TaxID=1314779 RepID=A0A6A6E3S1_9PEZI|nr:ankyrin [Zopfia rhizophila CBS 207.26]
MAFGHRIEKRRQMVGGKRGRGRPSDWSMSWQKRLIVLRLCGLQLSEVLEVLKILSGDTLKAKERRAQQILRDLLSDGYQRLCSSNKTVARKRMSFLRAIGRYDRTRKSKTRNRSRRPDLQYIEHLVHHDTGSGSSTTTPNSAEQRERSAKTSLADGAVAVVMPHDESNNNDTRSFISDRSLRIRAVFSKGSFSSSFISEMMSVMRKRFSRSSFTTSSGCSISTTSDNDTYETQNHIIQVLRTLELRKRKIEQANSALINMCCKEDKNCVHQRITRMTRLKEYTNYINELGDVQKTGRINTADSYGNDTLFFAARTGTPADVILAILQRTSVVNALNDDGQTFLFFLDPRGFHDSSCRCPHSVYQHQSRFECLIRHLERRPFNFDQIDHDGRHFLSFLCASPHFDIRWLVNIMKYSEVWRWRIGALSQCRDSSGTFLIDFLASHPDIVQWEEYILRPFRPQFTYNQSYAGVSRALAGEDALGQTPLHNLLQTKSFLQTQTPLHPLSTADMVTNINKYDCQGRTPLMKYLDKAFEERIAEELIVGTVRLLISWGANVNARSRAGSTILHFAAKKAMPELLAYALAAGAEVNHHDRDDFSALDYAANVFSKSRCATAPPELTARSLKCATRLLDHGAQTAIV